MYPPGYYSDSVFLILWHNHQLFSFTLHSAAEMSNKVKQTFGGQTRCIMEEVQMMSGLFRNALFCPLTYKQLRLQTLLNPLWRCISQRFLSGSLRYSYIDTGWSVEAALRLFLP